MALPIATVWGLSILANEADDAVVSNAGFGMAFNNPNTTANVVLPNGMTRRQAHLCLLCLQASTTPGRIWTQLSDATRLQYFLGLMGAAAGAPTNPLNNGGDNPLHGGNLNAWLAANTP